MTEDSISARFAHLPSITQTHDHAWNAAAAKYLLRDGLAFADRTFGDYAKASVAFDHAKAKIEAKYGRGFHASEEGSKAFEPVWEASRVAEETQYEKHLAPLWEAAPELALTPAPTLATARFKIEVIKSEELDNDTHMTRDPMEIVADDMVRIAAQAIERVEWDFLVRRYEAVELATPTDANIDKAGDLIERIMAKPAPDAAAARWKLDHLLDAPEGGSTGAWSSDFIAQAVADYRRFLTGEAQ